jgi:transcriptional regulator with XRE-family HTH domain
MSADDKGEPGPGWQMYIEVIKSRREELGYTQVNVGTLIGYTGAGISAAETFKVFPSEQMMAGFEEHLDTKTKLIKRLGAILKNERYPAFFRKYADLEALAYAILTYETLVIDGLFQTEAYARALLELDFPPLSDDKVQQLLDARMARKALFDRDPMAIITLVQDEYGLRRQIGSEETMRGQYAYLAEMAKRRNVNIRILPAASAHAGLNGPFTVVETAEHELLTYLEVQGNGILISEAAKVSELQHRYGMIQSQALGPAESLALIEKLAGEQ